MNKICLLLAVLLSISCTALFAQGTNLVPNPSFEDVNNCPTGISNIGGVGQATSPADWYKPTKTTPDYFNTCATSTSVSVPQNNFGYQMPRTGNAYAGCFVWMSNHYGPKEHPLVYHLEYIQAKLKESMKADHTYHVSFWVSLADGKGVSYNGFIIDQMGAYLGEGYVDSPALNDVLLLKPQIKNPVGRWLSDTTGWMQISGTFVASGGEDNICIGSFTPYDQQNTLVRNPRNRDSSVYYYIDDVCVFDLTEAVQTHDTVVCAQDINAFPLQARKGFTHYEWNTGDTTSILTIQQPGTYWVKGFSGDCAFAVDTYKVSISDPNPIINIDTFTLSTVQSYQTYQWLLNGNIIQGATDSVYTVTQNGSYQVIVTNQYGCKDTSDVYRITNYTGIRDVQNMAGQIHIYPNPAKDMVHIDAPIPVQAAITAMDGRLLKQSTNKTSISVKDLAAGMYLIQIRDKDGRFLKVEPVVLSQ